MSDVDFEMQTEKLGAALEIRAKGRKLEGYAAIFGKPANIGGGMIETIAPGAFTTEKGSLRANDVLALVDHDPKQLLARSRLEVRQSGLNRSGTLRLSEDSRGLAFDLDLPTTQLGKDIQSLAERGDLGGMSFAFTALDDELVGDRREVRAVYLHEISVVQAWPAYDGTVVNLRSKFAPKGFRDYSARALRLLELCA